MTDLSVLPPELNPRGPGRPIKPAKPVKGGGGWRTPLGITAAALAVCVLAASGLLYTRYLHYDHNLKKTRASSSRAALPLPTEPRTCCS